MKFDLRDYIIVLENVVPHELCDEIINEYSNSEDWLNAVTKGGALRNVRRCDNLDMSCATVIGKNETVRRDIDTRLFECAGNILRSYRENFSEITIEGDSGYTLLRYQEGEFYSQHTDHFLQYPRVVSCSISLNDKYEGGEFGFFNRQLKYKVPKGGALLFPSNFMYPHEVMPVTKFVRYSIVTWFI